MKRNLALIIGLTLMLLLITSCTTSRRSSDYEDLDQEPDICTDSEIDRLTRDAQNNYEDALDDYEDAYRDYEDALDDYDKDLEDYEDDLAKYEKDLKEYNDAVEALVKPTKPVKPTEETDCGFLGINCWFGSPESEYEKALEEYERDLEDYNEALAKLDEPVRPIAPILPVPPIEPIANVTTGINIESHILIYDGNNDRLYRNQTFSIVINQIDIGRTQTVTTSDAKATFTARLDFGELNEVEIRVTPINLVDDEFIPKTYVARKFIPCDDDPWVIEIPYTLRSNDSRYADEIEDADNIKIDGADFRVTESNPEPVTINEVLEFRFELKSADVVTVEYNPDQIKYVKLYYEDELLDTSVKPADETVFRDGNRESPFGPVESGDYRLVVFTSSEQPSTRLEIKTFEKEEVQEVGTIYFATKQTQVVIRDFLSDSNNRVGVVAILVVIMLLSQIIPKGGKK